VPGSARDSQAIYPSTVSTSTSSAAPAPRLGKRARTRQFLIEAAADLIREKGFANVSMEDVAMKAGVSRGSIYGNFSDRNDLFAAVAMYRMPRILPKPQTGTTLRERLRALGRTVAKAANENRHSTIYWAAYMQHALSDQDLLRRAEVQGREMRKQIAQEWAKVLPPNSLSMPIDTFTKVVSALTNSMIMAHSMSPSDYNEEVIVAAFEALAGATRSSARKTKR
jgi:AcrR family transcriptional regulator